MKKRVLITGGAGFIGTNLCRKLLEKNYEVICVDNLFSGQKENIKDLLNNPNFEFIRHDIIQPILLEVDEIYHLACPASPIHYQYNPVKTIKTNVIGTINMLGLAKRIKAKILLTSTSEVYGQPLEHPQKESYWGNVNPIGIRSCYDEGKRVAETLMMDYYRQNKVQIRIVRVFNTYGPYLHPQDGRVVSNFIIQALRDLPITIYGNGSQTRSFCYIDDMIDGLIKMMEQDEFIGPVNLGNPEEITINELAEKIGKILNKKLKFEYKPLPSDDPLQRRPDITLAKEKLNWEPKIPLITGLQKTIEYFQKRI
ncbi:MAG TPA: SDR family oxidoreductase [bacterium]|nr:SDR family oxidoreductase [bacterium]HOL48321.1 SDR family oxidoreductase [bacterium]HPQ18553.1 SDR family oxidoreductase [bacterium]